MSSIEDRVTIALNGAINVLVQDGIPVTPQSQSQVILDWHKAWTRVATTPEDEELTIALGIAYDRLFCTMHNIQH